LRLDYDIGEDCELVEDEQLAELAEATKFSREVSPTRHRNRMSHTRFRLVPKSLHSQGPSEQKPIKNFGEKGAWAYPGTA